MGSNATEKNGKDFNDIGFITQKNKISDVVRQFTSLDLLVEVAKRIDEQADYSEAVEIAEGIQDRLTVESEGSNSNVINFTYMDSSTAQAEKVLTLILNLYNEKWIKDKQKVITNSSYFIDSKLKLLESELNLVDDSISAFKSRYGITELENVSNIYLQQQSKADAEILQLRNQRAMAEYIRSLLEDDSSRKQLLLVNSGINNSLIESQISLYNSLLLQMQSHMEYTSGQNPLIINLEKELASLRKNILANVINHIRTIDIQLQSLQAYYGEATSKITSNPNQAKHLISIEREQKVKESLYMYLLQKKEENEISLTYQPAPTQIVDIPHGSGKPTSPKRVRVLLGAVLLGLILPLTVIFAQASMDNSVHKSSDIESRDDISFLGGIPFVEGKTSWLNKLRHFTLKSDSKPIVVFDGGQDPVNEAFRIVRARLETNDIDTENQVYMVTSAKKDTGKTFVAMNLALVLALANRRVLFIDADLRKGKASRLWNAPECGLTDYLNGTADDISQLFYHPEQYPTLDILPSGIAPANPTELLSNSLLGEFLCLVRPVYDYIIIDTPKANDLADAEIISRYADCQLTIIRAGVFERSNLDQLKQKENEESARLVILNGVSNEGFA